MSVRIGCTFQVRSNAVQNHCEPALYRNLHNHASVSALPRSNSNGQVVNSAVSRCVAQLRLRNAVKKNRLRMFSMHESGRNLFGAFTSCGFSAEYKWP